MTSVVVVAALVVLALITQAGVLILQRAYPAQGRMVEVAGATLNVVEIRPRDAAGLPGMAGARARVSRIRRRRSRAK